ncbi:hypothetical protein [Streptomyces sp. RTd22]|uniref:hypothetical protein n=1 Tax=Streptomyces sp. RTd22 TaxID=1841249 RepID=UPI000ABFBE53|nr:hypothetical protein [Streptomyces sp. RTd22]
MTGHHESTGPDPALSSDSVRRVTQYQTADVNARLKVFALLEAGAQSEVVELDGMAPASRGEVFADGCNDSVTAVSEALVGIADRDWSRRGGRPDGAAELAVHIVDVRQRERADLMRLERFVREAVLPRTHPHTTARRRVLEALGEADGLCTARTVKGDGGYVVCTLGRAPRPGRQAALQGRKTGRLAPGERVDL